MNKYRVTQITRGIGLSGTATQTERIEEHLNEQSGVHGWELVQADKSSWEIPVTWRFIWKVPSGAKAGTGDMNQKPKAKKSSKQQGK